MALVFHRPLMPDGYSVDLDRFAGLNQIGDGGIKDKVNNHYLQIFGTSIALGIVGGAAELSASNADERRVSGQKGPRPIPSLLGIYD